MNKKLHHAIVGLLAIAILLLLNVGFIFFLLGFLPTLVAYMVDDTPKKDLYKTVRACNFAGMLPTLVMLAEHEYPAAALQVTMSDPMVWLVVYGSAGLGWLLIAICRFVAYLLILTRNQARTMLLENTQEQLLKEWGDDIKH